MESWLERDGDLPLCSGPVVDIGPSMDDLYPPLDSNSSHSGNADSLVLIHENPWLISYFSWVPSRLAGCKSRACLGTGSLVECTH